MGRVFALFPTPTRLELAEPLPMILEPVSRVSRNVFEPGKLERKSQP